MSGYNNHIFSHVELCFHVCANVSYNHHIINTLRTPPSSRAWQGNRTVAVIPATFNKSGATGSLNFAVSEVAPNVRKVRCCTPSSQPWNPSRHRAVSTKVNDKIILSNCGHISTYSSSNCVTSRRCPSRPEAPKRLQISTEFVFLNGLHISSPCAPIQLRHGYPVPSAIKSYSQPLTSFHLPAIWPVVDVLDLLAPV